MRIRTSEKRQSLDTPRTFACMDSSELTMTCKGAGLLEMTHLRILFIAGLTMTTLAWPLSTHAQQQGDLCQSLGESRAIGEYAQQIIKRATAGLKYAQGSDIVSDFSLYIPGWVRVVTKSVVLWMDTSMRVHRQTRDLAENTSCLRFDLLLLECKMDVVRKALEKALNDHSFVAILRLDTLGRFLQNTFSDLTLGAREPTYADDTWHQDYIFDDPDEYQLGRPVSSPDTEPACGNATLDRGEECDGTLGCSSDCKNEMCPFHSDYLPPSSTGFGCTVEILERIKDVYKPAQDDYDALKKIMDQLKKNEKLTGPMRKHRAFAGCARRVCEGNPLIFCDNDDACGADRPCVSDKNVGRCENNRDRFCARDDQCEGSPCVLLSEATVWETRGPFRLEKDQGKIMNVFRELRESEEAARPIPEVYQSFEDAPSSDGNGGQVQGLFVNVFRQLSRSILQTRSKEQGRAESMIFAQASDGQQEIARALQPLRSAVSDFAKLSSEKRGGIREFVVKYAYFLRRTCMYRPCNKKLEWILKMALADECFPYTNGEFLDDSPDNPRWEKCEEKAKEN